MFNPYIALFALIIGVIVSRYYTNHIYPAIQRIFERKYRVDLGIMYRIALCAETVSLEKDTSDNDVLIFSYRGNTYSIHDNCTLRMGIAPGHWSQRFAQNDAINFINSMEFRKPAKQQNNDTANNQQKQNNNNNNSQSKQQNNDNGNNKNVIPADQAEKWLRNGKSWDNKPKGFTLQEPYYLYLSNIPDETEGLWVIGKRSKNGNKS